MVERRKVLQMCQLNSVSNRSVGVIYKGFLYYPKKIIIWFDANGKTMNTAEMECAVSKSILNARIEDLEEIKNDG